MTTTDKYPVPAPTPTTPLGSAAYVIAIAKSQIGYVEGPKSNQTKYGAFTKVDFNPWCGSFTDFCFAKGGTKVPKCVLTKAGATVFNSQKRFHTTPKVGDLAFMVMGSGALTINNVNHIGLVTKINADGTTVNTIDGNTSTAKQGDQRNGGEVAAKVRAYGKNKGGILVSIVGFGRADYAKSTATPAPIKVEKVVSTSAAAVTPNPYPGSTIDPGEFGDAVKFIQRKLGATPDGQYGPVTKKVVIAFQEKNKALGETGGVVGPKTWRALSKL